MRIYDRHLVSAWDTVLRANDYTVVKELEDADHIVGRATKNRVVARVVLVFDKEDRTYLMVEAKGWGAGAVRKEILRLFEDV